MVYGNGMNGYLFLRVRISTNSETSSSELHHIIPFEYSKMGIMTDSGSMEYGIMRGEKKKRKFLFCF